MNRNLILTSAITVALATGCSNNPNKEDWGTALGSVGGAALGAMIAGDDNRWLGAAIGGALGFYAGKQIGRYLDEQDQQALAEETAQALAMESAGTSTWQSARSGASAEIKTGDISYTNQDREVKRLATVQAVPAIKLENEEYQTTSSLRVRSGPGTRYDVITTLKPGDVVNSAGRTDNGWLMLAKQDVTVGYVHANYVKPYSPVDQAHAQGINLDNVDVASIEKQEAFGGIDLDAVETTSSTVTAQAGCRDVEISVKTENGVEKETSRACQRPDGVWQLG
jgi:surface antigen